MFLVELLAGYSKLYGVRRTMEQLQIGVARGDGRPISAKTGTKAFRLSQRLTAKQIDEVVAAYQGGMTSPELTQRFSMGKGSVLKVLHEAGAILPRRGLSKSQIQQAVELYAAGWSLAKIADTFETTASTVRRHLLSAGGKTRDCHGNER